MLNIVSGSMFVIMKQFTLGHFIFRWNQSLKPWFETEIKPKHKVTLKFGFKPSLKPNLPLKPKFETKVLQT